MFLNPFEKAKNLFNEEVDYAKDVIDRLVEQHKISQQEGKSLLDEFSDYTRTAQSKIRSIVDKALDKAGYAPTEEVENIKSRISILEKLLNNRQ